jgi:hypothetical protein
MLRYIDPQTIPLPQEKGQNEKDINGKKNTQKSKHRKDKELLVH